jgi:hypothetical protein
MAGRVLCPSAAPAKQRTTSNTTVHGCETQVRTCMHGMYSSTAGNFNVFTYTSLPLQSTSQVSRSCPTTRPSHTPTPTQHCWLQSIRTQHSNAMCKQQLPHKRHACLLLYLSLVHSEGSNNSNTRTQHPPAEFAISGRTGSRPGALASQLNNLLLYPRLIGATRSSILTSRPLLQSTSHVSGSSPHRSHHRSTAQGLAAVEPHSAQ